MSEDVKLKPCPFCGQDAQAWREGRLANCEHHDGDLFPMPAKVWNSRPLEDAQNAAISKAMSSAVAAIYFDDGSDYGAALWSVIKALGGQEAADLLEEDEHAAYKKYCDGDDDE